MVGKIFDLDLRSVANAPEPLVRLLGMALISFCAPLTPKRLDVLLGHMNWFFQPRPGMALFVSSWYSLRWNANRYKGYAPPKLVSSLLDAVAICFQTYQFPKIRTLPLLSPFFVDAACIHDKYQLEYLT